MLTSDRTVPGPGDATPDGTAYELRHDPVAFVTRLHQAYGDIVRLPLGTCNMYLLSDPASIREIFTEKPEVFRKRQDEATEKSYLVAIGGFVPFFEAARIPGYAPMMVETAASTSQRWRAAYQQKGVLNVDIYREMMRLTVEIVSQTLFHKDARADSEAVVEALLELNTGYGFDPIEANLGPVLPPIQVALSDQGTAARQRILEFVQRQVAAEVAAPADPPAFLSLLVKYMGPDAAASVGLTVMLAMHEVAANTLTWAWYLLAPNPEAEAK